MKISLKTKLSLMFITTALLFAAIGIFLIWRLWSFSASFYRDAPAAVREFSRVEVLDDLADKVRYYDEVLTQSARNYAFTADKRWKERYENAEPMLDSIIKEAMGKGDAIDKEIFRHIDEANIRLVETEHESLRLTEGGHAAQALGILNGADYDKWKKIYGTGLEDFFKRKAAELENAKTITMDRFADILKRRETVLRAFTVSFVLFILFVAALFAAKYVLISKFLIRPLSALQEFTKKVASGDMDGQIRLDTGDEIGKLAGEFNAMVSNLKTLMQGSERYIKELEAVNRKLVAKEAELSALNKNLIDLRLNLESRVGERTAFLAETQQAVLNIMADLQESKKEVDETNIKVRKAYEELKETQARLVQAEKMSALGRFSSGIAHEVKNPLSIILSGMEYLNTRLGAADLDTKTALEKIKDAVFRADRVIQNLLRFSRPSKMETEKTRLRDIVSEAAGFFKYKAPLVNIAIDIKLPEKPFYVSVDKNQIQQVIFNLMANSVDAMPRGGNITISVYRKETESSGIAARYGVVEVSDTGEGMSESDKAKMWEPFFTTKRDKGGTGLGLPVSKGIIENHGGFMEIESAPGKGTVVRVMLPIVSQ